jgi:hypothetical protein
VNSSCDHGWENLECYETEEVRERWTPARVTVQLLSERVPYQSQCRACLRVPHARNITSTTTTTATTTAAAATTYITTNTINKHNCNNKTTITNRKLFLLKKAVFWDVAPCINCVNRRFGGTSVAPAEAGSLADFFLYFTLKMEEKRSSETSINTISTRRHIPENGFLHSHRRENLKSCMRVLFLLL